MDAVGKLGQGYRTDRNGGVEVPQEIRDLMAAQNPPIKNLRQLALRMEHAPSAVHRIFSGKNSHGTLQTYKRISEICDWSLEQFFSIAYGNDPESIGAFIRARLSKLNISTTVFRRHVSEGTGDSGGPVRYIDGSHKYERLNLYWRLKSSLGITADTMYELLLIREPLTALSQGGKLYSSKANEIFFDKD